MMFKDYGQKNKKIIFGGGVVPADGGGPHPHAKDKNDEFTNDEWGWRMTPGEIEGGGCRRDCCGWSLAPDIRLRQGFGATGSRRPLPRREGRRKVSAQGAWYQWPLGFVRLC